MIKWIKEKWNSYLAMYRLLFWSHLFYAIVMFVACLSGEAGLNLNFNAFISSLVIVMLSATLIKGIKNDN